MTVRERELQDRVEVLEASFANFLHVVDLLDFEVHGDLREDFLRAYAYALIVVPAELYRPLPRMTAGSYSGEDVGMGDGVS